MVEIRYATTEGERTIKAAPTTTPGLFVHKQEENKNRWQISTLAGFFITGGFCSKKDAMLFAGALDGWTDWSSEQPHPHAGSLHIRVMNLRDHFGRPGWNQEQRFVATGWRGRRRW